MVKLEFNVTYDGGSKVTVTTRPAGDIAFEKRYGKSIVNIITNAPQTEDKAELARWFTTAVTEEQTAFMAWKASRDAREFDEWLETVDEIEWTLASRVDPTNPAPFPDSSVS